MRHVAWPIVALVVLACGPGFDPPSYISGLRVLAVRADPPEVAAGETTHLTALAVDSGGRPITLRWDYCLLAPEVGKTYTVNSACILNETGPYLTPVGEGTEVDLTMPRINIALVDGNLVSDLGPPDSTAGFYLPVKLRAGVASSPLVPLSDATALTAVYRLRYSPVRGLPVNHNPKIAAVEFSRTFAGGIPVEPYTALDDDTLLLRVGEPVYLRARLTDGSVETYPSFEVDTSTNPPTVKMTMQDERVRFSWYVTAGIVSPETSGVERPDVVFAASGHLPPGTGPAKIRIFVVAREERGGADFAEREITLER